jgi:hypothetical protein
VGKHHRYHVIPVPESLAVFIAIVLVHWAIEAIARQAFQ